MKYPKIFLYFRKKKSFEERKIEYINNVYEKNKYNLCKFIYENYEILNNIKHPIHNEIKYIKKELKDKSNYIYFSPEIKNYFCLIIIICIFLKDNNIESDKWYMYLFSF